MGGTRDARHRQFTDECNAGSQMLFSNPRRNPQERTRLAEQRRCDEAEARRDELHAKLQENMAALDNSLKNQADMEIQAASVLAQAKRLGASLGRIGICELVWVLQFRRLRGTLAMLSA